MPIAEPFFTEDWYAPERLAVLADLARACLPLAGAFVEIGCWEGRSTLAIAQAIGKRELHAVDTWAGSPDHESRDLAARRDVYGQFCRNLAGRKSVLAKIMNWRAYVATHAGPVAFVHIDGDHTYEEVHDCVTAFLPRMTPGGIICGHDYWAHFPGVMRAVDDVFPHAQKSGELWWQQVAP